MKDLKILFSKVKYTMIDGYFEGDYSEIVTSVNKVSKDCIFVCIQDGDYDSHQYIREIIDADAKVIVTQAGNPHLEEFLEAGGVSAYIKNQLSANGQTAGFSGMVLGPPPVTIVSVEDTRACLEKLELED